MIKVMWVGYGGNAYLAEELRPLIKSLGMELVCIHEHENANILWNRNTWLDELRKADIIICPSKWKVQDAKSANRLTQGMALGKPIICSPLHAYMKIIKDYPSCSMVAETEEQWKECLIKLRDDEELRKNMSIVAKDVAQSYSPQAITDKWEKLILAKTKVDIIIPSYRDEKYLELCLESIKKCTTVKNNVIVVDATNPRRNFSQAVNYGVSQSKAEWICISNSDLIFSKNWLENILNTKADIIGILSNCDKGFLHNYNINIGGVELLPGINTVEQITPIINNIYNWKSPYNEIIERDWIAAYFWLFKKEVWDIVGKLDEKFMNGCEDLDWCRRAKKLGLKIATNFNGFVYHFGGRSRGAYEKENESYSKEDIFNHAYLKEKWGEE